jgi:hypothetical protein
MHGVLACSRTTVIAGDTPAAATVKPANPTVSTTAMAHSDVRGSGRDRAAYVRNTELRVPCPNCGAVHSIKGDAE